MKPDLAVGVTVHLCTGLIFAHEPACILHHDDGDGIGRRLKIAQYLSQKGLQMQRKTKAKLRKQGKQLIK